MFLFFSISASNVFLLDFFSQGHNGSDVSLYSHFQYCSFCLAELHVQTMKGSSLQHLRTDLQSLKPILAPGTVPFAGLPLPSPFPYRSPVSLYLSPHWLWVVSKILTTFYFLLCLVLLHQDTISMIPSMQITP